MYATLIQKIKNTLALISSVSQYGTTPGEEITGYPYVFFKPEGFINEFETGQENAIVYNFMMIVVVSTEGQGGSVDHAFSTVLPSVVDDIVAQFNADWDQGTINGHRVRVLVDTAAAWEVTENDEGVEAYAPLNIQIRTLTDI